MGDTKRIIKRIHKKIFTIYSQMFCLSQPVLFVNTPIYGSRVKEVLTDAPDVYFC